jgi:hypothetical protein
MVAAFSMSRPATLGSGDALWRACRQRASFQHWQPSLFRSASVHTVLAERQPEPTPTELRGSPAKELRRTRKARSPDIVSRPTDVPLREDSPFYPRNPKNRSFPDFQGTVNGAGRGMARTGNGWHQRLDSHENRDALAIAIKMRVMAIFIHDYQIVAATPPWGSWSRSSSIFRRRDLS